MGGRSYKECGENEKGTDCASLEYGPKLHYVGPGPGCNGVIRLSTKINGAQISGPTSKLHSPTVPFTFLFIPNNLTCPSFREYIYIYIYIYKVGSLGMLSRALLMFIGKSNITVRTFTCEFNHNSNRINLIENY